MAVRGAEVRVIRTNGGRERFWLVTDEMGPRADYCIDQAITTAMHTGSVGAVFEYGGDGIEESAASVVEMLLRKPGS